MSAAFGLARVFGDHMVLQRDKPLEFWGTGSAGDRVTLTWRSSGVDVTAEARVDEHGAWRLRVAAQAASGPHELSFRASDARVTLQDVWVGEVWLASGQSNMEWTVAQSDFVDEELALATEPKLRWLYVERRTATEPSTEAHCRWQRVTPDTAWRMTAIGYAFGRHLCAKLGVAVGIVDASWGGTPVEAWVSPEALGQVLDLTKELGAWQSEEQQLDEVRRSFGQTLRAWEKQHLVQDDSNRGEAEGWHQAEPAWDAPTLNVPTIWQRHGMEFNGAVWFRKELELPADWSGATTLQLGRIDDFDHTYVNGVLVGANPQGTPLSCEIVRRYAVPAHALRPGRNVIAVRIFDHVGEGGFLDPASTLYLENENGARVGLAGAWQYRVEREVPLAPPGIWAHYPRAPRVLQPHYRPTALFHGMIAPLLGLSLRGFIWYQGEANVAEHQHYLQRFSALIRDWQGRFGGDGGPVPFYFVQLASFEESGKWAYLREAQAQALELPHTGMVCTLDIGNPRDIHPRNKREVGRRLALVALSRTYGIDVGPARGPVASACQLSSGEIWVDYAEQASLATADGAANVLGFEVVDADGQAHPAPARLQGNRVHVQVPFAGAARGVHYAFRDAPPVNLTNSAGLPAEPFRWSFPGS
jgi:sialate O-acetylesterase